MANSYAKFGEQIGDILGSATMGSPMATKGRLAGVDAGSQHMLRSAQTGKATADMDKIMYELGLAQKAEQTTGADIATAMGVPAHVVGALGRGETSSPALPGPEGPSPGIEIPPAMTDKFTRANTLKILQQLAGGTGSGGTAASLTEALAGGQEMGILDALLSGSRQTGDVASIQAAMQGKLPGRTGAEGGSQASKVQELNHLINVLKVPKEKAILIVQGDPAMKLWGQVFTAQKENFASDAKAKKAADAALEQYEFNIGLETGPAGAPPPGAVVKRYK